jgi:hypothetical protein
VYFLVISPLSCPLPTASSGNVVVARAPPVVPGGGPFWVTRLGRACSVCSADPDHYLLCLAAALRASRRHERVRQRGGVCVFQGEGVATGFVAVV